MYRLVSVFALFLVLLPASAMAETFRLAEDLVLKVDLPAERWQALREPSSALVDQVTEHMQHDLENQGKKVAPEKVRKVAKKRLAANELFILSNTGAHIEIDISPLASGEKGPSAGTVRKSARYAGQSMTSEAGVSGATSSVSDFDIPGASVAYRLDIDYEQHAKEMKFVGIVGFEDPYWLYFYGTDPLLDERDAEQMEQIIESFRIVSENGD